MLWVFASASAAVLAVSPDGGRVGFELGSSLHPVEGAAGAFAGTLDTDTLTGAVQVDAATLRTGVGPRDSRMLSTCLEVARFPAITLAIARVEGAVDGLRRGAGTGAITLAGPLTIRDVTRDVSIPATYAWEGDNLHLEGRYPMKWSDWSIPDPSTLLARVDAELTVQFDVLAKPR